MKYKPQLLTWIEKMFNHAKEKEWYETYHAFDIHGVISKPDYRKTEEVGKEYYINYYPYAKETLQFITKNRPDMILFLFTSSYPDEIEKYLKQFEEDNIHFKYVNENPEISDAKGSFGCYDRKPYFNTIFEDKSGFEPLKDWKPIYEYFINSDYKPNPCWSLKTIESYHEVICIDGNGNFNRRRKELTEDELAKKYENIEDKIPSVWSTYEVAGRELANDLCYTWNVSNGELIRVIALMEIRVRHLKISQHINPMFAFAGLYPERMINL
jgi:hypothetical protein